MAILTKYKFTNDFTIIAIHCLMKLLASNNKFTVAAAATSSRLSTTTATRSTKKVREKTTRGVDQVSLQQIQCSLMIQKHYRKLNFVIQTRL